MRTQALRGAHSDLEQPRCARNHIKRQPRGGRSELSGSHTGPRIHLNLPLRSPPFLLLPLITAGGVSNERGRGPATKAHCDAVTAIRCVRRKSGLSKICGVSTWGPGVLRAH